MSVISPVPNPVDGVALRALGLAVLVLALAAGVSPAAAAAKVDPAIADGSAQRELEAARSRWRAARIVDYHFTVRRICFCVPSFTQPATVVVRAGAPLEPPEHLREVATVPRLQRVVQQAIDARVAALSVRYDDVGVPLEIYIDRDRAIADEEVHYVVEAFTVDNRDLLIPGDVDLLLRWVGPGGDAVRTLSCDGGRLRSVWPDVDVCQRLLAARVLRDPITVETRDLRFTDDPRLFSAVGQIEAERVNFSWSGSGSGTRLARLREWERALGPAAIRAIREPGSAGSTAAPRQTSKRRSECPCHLTL